MRRKTPDTEFTTRSRERIRYLIDARCDGKQIEFSKKTGIPKGTVSNYVNGNNVPSDEYARKIANTFRVNFYWIKGFDIDMNALETFRSIKTSAEFLEAEKEHSETIYANVFDAAGYRLESSDYRGEYIASRFPDGTTYSQESIRITSEELEEFNTAVTEYADYLIQKMFKGKNSSLAAARPSITPLSDEDGDADMLNKK